MEKRELKKGTNNNKKFYKRLNEQQHSNGIKTKGTEGHKGKRTER